METEKQEQNTNTPTQYDGQDMIDFILNECDIRNKALTEESQNIKHQAWIYRIAISMLIESENNILKKKNLTPEDCIKNFQKLFNNEESLKIVKDKDILHKAIDVIKSLQNKFKSTNNE